MQTSFLFNFNVCEIFLAEKTMFFWVRGTIFGLEVVPDVWRTKAWSFPLELLSFVSIKLLTCKLNVPAGSLLFYYTNKIGILDFFAAITLGVKFLSQIKSLTLRSFI